MIRCYPIDGSEPFEVENDSKDSRNQFTLDEHAETSGNHCGVIRDGASVFCRIESWRERAERLERELSLTFQWSTEWNFNLLSGRLGTLAEVWVFERSKRTLREWPDDKPPAFVAGAKDMSGCLMSRSEEREFASLEEAKREAERVVLRAMMSQG